MNKYYTIQLTSESTSPGPYTIYWNSPNSAPNIPTIYPTTQLAQNLGLLVLQNGVTISVPDITNIIYVYNQTALCTFITLTPPAPPITYQPFCLIFENSRANTFSQYEFSFDSIVSGYPTWSTSNGDNVIQGNISDINLKANATFEIGGYNTITGNISTITTNPFSSISIDGLNDITGVIQSLPNTAKRVSIGGNNTISGDFSLVHTLIKILAITGNNTITTFTNSGAIFSSLEQIMLNSSVNGLDSTNFDKLLISYSNSTWSTPKSLGVKGTSTPKFTVAAQTAYNTLVVTKGVTITLY